jgi:hypothetical protein
MSANRFSSPIETPSFSENERRRKGTSRLARTDWRVRKGNRPHRAGPCRTVGWSLWTREAGEGSEGRKPLERERGAWSTFDAFWRRSWSVTIPGVEWILIMREPRSGELQEARHVIKKERRAARQQRSIRFMAWRRQTGRSDGRRLDQSYDPVEPPSPPEPQDRFLSRPLPATRNRPGRSRFFGISRRSSRPCRDRRRRWRSQINNSGFRSSGNAQSAQRGRNVDALPVSSLSPWFL